MSLSHSQRVIRLYRKSLKSIRDYSEDYDWFLTNALHLRNTLKARKNETNPFLVQQHMKDFEKFADYWEHPDPYIPCDAPGGSKWQRNIPPPKWAVNPKSHLLNED